MLRLFSRMERARNWLIIIFALVIGLSMVLFTFNRYANPNASAATNAEVLASVDGEDITVGDLNRIKENYRSMFGGQISLAQLGGDRRFLDGLVRDRVIAQEAIRQGLGASDAEVAAAIRKQYTDPSTGKFVGMERYKERAAAQYGSVQKFEETMRNQIAADKLRAFVTAGVTVSEKEVEEDYRRKNSSFDLTFVPVTAESLAEKVKPSDEEVQKFYDEHKAEFRYFDAQVKIRYLFVSQTKAGEKLNVSDADLRAAYDQLKPENRLAGVRAQQIVLKVATPALDAQVFNKANTLLAELRKDGTVVSAEKFAEVAKGNSEDPATAKAGGWLPKPVKKNPAATKDPLQHVFDVTQEGEVYEPTKYGDAYYIVRRGESVTKTFEEAKPELLASQRNQRAYKSAAGIAARAAARLKETKDYQKVAQELAAEANMTPAEMIKETPFIKPGDDVPDIGSSPQFEEAIKPLQSVGDIGDRVAIKNGFAIPSLVERREPRIPDLSEVKDKVAARVKQEKARGQLEQTAREIAGSANSAADLKAAAAKVGLEAKSLPSYKLGTPFAEAGTSPAADEVVNALKDGEISKTPIKVGETWVVVGMTKRKDADLAEFAKQRDSITQTTLSSRRTDVFEDYVGTLKARLEREGKIKVYDEVLARVAEDDAVDLPRPPVVPRSQ
ncbi:MAG: SurA N-terminal domain-containing protein [Acidobacteria bacterium]|nr:SurA N-terminal domain-containing protein [Acidobacteriota bacterium]MCA1642253.1 SurA N-terminal domain-containing protein [Acidobacteriota bacterium]